MKRMVVVGGGIGGLAAAALLGRAGHRVTLLEAAPYLGGKSRRIRLDGQVVDTGPSLVAFPRVWEEFLRRWDGLGGEGSARAVARLKLVRLPEVGRYYFRGNAVPLPVPEDPRCTGTGDDAPAHHRPVRSPNPACATTAPGRLRNEADHEELPGQPGVAPGRSAGGHGDPHAKRRGGSRPDSGALRQHAGRDG